MRRIAASLVLVLVALAAPGAAGTALGLEIEGGACSLVTERELREAFGGRRWPEAQGGPDDPLRCARHNDQLGRRSKAVLVKFTPATQEQSESFQRDFISSYPGSEVEVAGFPAVQDEGSLHVFVGPQGWLSVEMSTESDRDHGRLAELATLAVGRLDPALLAPSDPATAPSEPVDPSGGLCAIVDVAAVAAAIGEPVTVTDQGDDVCGLSGDLAGGSLTNVVLNIGTGDPMAITPMIDEVREAFPGAAEIEVGGVPALQAEPADAGIEGYVQAQLAVFPDPATVIIITAIAPDTVDPGTALVAIAEQALAGMGVAASS